LAFDVNGLLFTTAAHPAPAADAGSSGTASKASSSGMDLPPVAGWVLASLAALALALALVLGRRRAIRSV
jgi:hypothetical protein